MGRNRGSLGIARSWEIALRSFGELFEHNLVSSSTDLVMLEATDHVHTPFLWVDICRSFWSYQLGVRSRSVGVSRSPLDDGKALALDCGAAGLV